QDKGIVHIDGNGGTGLPSLHAGNATDDCLNVPLSKTICQSRADPTRDDGQGISHINGQGYSGLPTLPTGGYGCLKAPRHETVLQALADGSPDEGYLILHFDSQGSGGLSALHARGAADECLHSLLGKALPNFGFQLLGHLLRDSSGNVDEVTQETCETG